MEPQNKYRYLVTMSRMIGSKNTYTRINAQLGQILLQETAPVNVKVDESDYTEMLTYDEIDSLTGTAIELKVPRDECDRLTGNLWTHYSIYRTENINGKNVDLATVGETYIWCEDVPCVRFLNIETIDYYEYEPLSLIPGLAVFSSWTPLLPSDEGNIIYVSGFKLKIQKIISTTEAFLTFYNDLPLNTNQLGNWNKMGVIGVSDTDTSNIIYFSSRNKPIESDYAEYTEVGNQLQIREDLIGKQIMFPNGEVGIIVSGRLFGGYAIYKIYELTGEPKLTNCAVFSPISRIYKDTVKDEILRSRKESGDPLYYLQTRFFTALPNGKIGAVAGGAYFTTRYNCPEYYYSQVANLYRTGYYHTSFQYNKKPVGNITRLKSYPDGLVIFGQNSTYLLDLSVSLNSGEPLVGEYVITYLDPKLLTNNVGTHGDSNCAEVDNGVEIILTGETAVRTFDGQRYSGNIADNSIQKTKIDNLYYDNVVSYDTRNGIRIWGSNAVKGKKLNIRTSPIERGDIIETGHNDIEIIESGNRDKEVIEGAYNG